MEQGVREEVSEQSKAIMKASVLYCWQGRLTVRGELVPLKHSDTQDVLLQILDEELTVGIPLGVQCVLNQKEEWDVEQQDQEVIMD